MTEACLVILTGEGKDGQDVHLLVPGRKLTVGRYKSNHVVLRDEHCSRHHAEFYDKGGRWHVRDLSSQNGTYVNGKRIKNTALEDEAMIRVGQVHLRFSTRPSVPHTPTMPEVEGLPENGTPVDLPSSAITETQFQSDDLSALCVFMADAVNDLDSRKIVERALEVVQQRIRADVVGFLALDEDGELLPRLVLPDEKSVDTTLSRSLTQQVENSRQSIWLSRHPNQVSSESLMSFKDAICVPLVAGAETLLGALHAYVGGRLFEDRDFKFCDIVGRHLASSLRLLRLRKQLEAENSRLRLHVLPDHIVGDSPAMQRLRQRIERAAPQAATVLICGESGVGKELVAEALHQRGFRKDGPFVVMNCAAIPASLMESQLFGHKKGAFTGADADYEGFFQQADGGTLFLDEIGELSPDCQAKLLRVLEMRRFMPVGGTKETLVDVRFVAATNRDLEQEVRTGKFRQDLYFRLKVIEIVVPPLRQHAEDISQLAKYFLELLGAKSGRKLQLSARALQALKEHPWPGNVRQLRSTLESAVALSSGGAIDLDDLPPLKRESATSVSGPADLNLSKLKGWAVGEALQRSDNQINKAAKLLGVARSTLYKLAERYGYKLDS